MYFDMATGRSYPTAAALKAAQQARKEETARTIRWATERRLAQERRRLERLSEWDGYREGNAVLLTPRASRERFPAAATPEGVVQVDGLLLRIDLETRQAHVRFTFLGDPQQEIHVLAHHELERPLGHPLTVWNRHDFRAGAKRRHEQYGAGQSPWGSTQRFWS